MARAALGLSVRDLAQMADVTPNTVSRIENGAGSQTGTMERLRRALEAAGVEFIDTTGVRLKPADR